ncbi:hypothetical protein [Streptomyces cucumeris]|uniref:hypothetical protein n=1 Tax=Streptomyces cucumeris TaxID=2962890 RepID=UPI0020C863E1|nr:hypothetical protein [Streptomyces sp. NEAU-Y11]MCP9209561.1 hypothetical protein [Streptomyces sp. NEAU-Y11]
MRYEYEEMMDWKHREECGGREREIGLTSSDLADCEPELAVAVAEIYAHDNGKRRESNLRRENAELRALLKENGIGAPDWD